MNKNILLVFLLAGCSDPGMQWADEQQQLTETYEEQTPESQEQTGSARPWQLPQCIHLDHTFTDWFGDFGIEVVVAEVDRWLLATGNEPGAIPVVFDERCPIRLQRGPVPQPDSGGVHAGVTRPDGTIVVYDAAVIWECNPPTAHIALAPVIAHELGHAFGCQHDDESRLMAARGPQCAMPGIDAVAAACATRLWRR